MSMFRLKLLTAAALAWFAAGASAEDELVIYTFKDGAPAAGLSASLDGQVVETLTPNGSAVFDLAPGAHSVQLLENGSPVHSFRFNSAPGQKVDINVVLQTGAEPVVDVETYFDTESASERADAPLGSVTGRVIYEGLPLAAATVAVRGTGVTVQTDEQGIYRLELPRGVYPVDVSHPSLPTPRSEEVRVVSRVDINQNLLFAAAPGAVVEEFAGVEEVVITAAPRAAELEERTAVSIVDSIDIEQLARIGGSDVAASVVRVPSITLQSDKYVFIRGLGDRYITTTLNGSTLPSPDPSKRTVPLDLFPSNIVQQLDVKKTFIASMPGESTGGLLEINTRSFPSEAGGKLSVSLGFIPGLSGETVYADPIDGDWDAFGFDDGSREEDGLLPLISTALDFPDEYSENTRFELQQAGGLLIRENWDLDTETANPKGSLGANYGNVFSIGSGDAEFGYFAAANYSNGWSQRDEGISRSYTVSGALRDDFEFTEQTNVVDTSALLALGLNVGESTLGTNTIVSRTSESSVTLTEGFDGDSLQESYRYDIDWIERQFVAQQVLGEHQLGSLLAKWQVTGSQARRYAPDRREVRFDLAGSDGIYNLEVPSLLRRFDDLTDDNLDASTDWTYEFAPTDFGVSNISIGAQLIERERDADSASYGFNGGQTSVDDNAPNRLVSDVITVDNITGDPSTGYSFQDKTLPSDSYVADLSLYAGYLSYDLTFLESYQVIVGGRYESYQQTTDTFDVNSGDPVQSEIDEGIFLPALSLNWFYTSDQQLRLAASRTISRPDFKETSNAVFYDTEFDYRVRGNPNLQVSEATNFDLRWEKYWSGAESVSVAAFYKDLDSPIERVVQPASGTAGNSRTYRNAESGEIYGIELDGRREFGINDAFTRSVFVALNASLIESEVTLESGDTRKLQGQPEYTANLIFGYDDLPTNQEVTLLFNQNGESIQDVGVSGLPDVIEEPRLSVDLNYRYEHSDAFTFRVKAKNLLDSDVEFTQGGQTFQQYNRGVELEAGVDWNF